MGSGPVLVHLRLAHNLDCRLSLGGGGEENVKKGLCGALNSESRVQGKVLHSHVDVI